MIEEGNILVKESGVMSSELKRVIGVTTAILLVAGNIIGTGVFKKLAPMAASGVPGNYILYSWMFAGIITMFGAFTIAGLAKLTTASGGIVEYLRIVFGDFSAFILGWTYFIINGSGAIAAVAFIFAQSLNSLITIPNPLDQWREISLGPYIHPFADSGIKIIAACAIAFLTWVNYRGTKKGAGLNNVVTTIKIIGVLSLIILGLFFTGNHYTNENIPMPAKTSHGLPFAIIVFGIMLNAFFAYDGFANVGAVAGEIKNPKKNVPVAIITGIVLVLFLYTLTNYAYMRSVPLKEFASLDQNKVAAIVVAQSILGNTGTVIFSVLIILSAFGYLNAGVLVFARYYYRMAEEKFFFANAAKVHPRYKTPHVALIYSMVWSCILVFSGTFDILTDLATFVAFAFYILLALALIKMKRRGAIKEKIWGYPLAPLLFILFTTGVLTSTFINNPIRTATGICLCLTGVPFYYYFKRINRRIDE